MEIDMVKILTETLSQSDDAVTASNLALKQAQKAHDEAVITRGRVLTALQAAKELEKQNYNKNAEAIFVGALNAEAQAKAVSA